MASGQSLPFTIVVEDCAGNSFVENLYAPRPDPHMTVRHFNRYNLHSPPPSCLSGWWDVVWYALLTPWLAVRCIGRRSKTSPWVCSRSMAPIGETLGYGLSVCL